MTCKEEIDMPDPNERFVDAERVVTSVPSMARIVWAIVGCAVVSVLSVAGAYFGTKIDLLTLKNDLKDDIGAISARVDTLDSRINTRIDDVQRQVASIDNRTNNTVPSDRFALYMQLVEALNSDKNFKFPKWEW